MKKFHFLMLLVIVVVASLACDAEPPRSPATSTNVPVIMLSDLHFDPYADPAKVARLRIADVAQWARILSQPASPKATEEFNTLQKACNMRGADSSWEVLSSTLHAVHEQQPRALFVTVSGDLLAHEFDCRMRALLPSATAQDINAFAEKTVAFVALQLRTVFAGVPVYLALGNNDSGCKDYWETQNSDFLQNAAQSFAPALTDAAGRRTLLDEFSSAGDYDVALPPPMQHTRLIVLQDIFQSASYKGCDGKPAPDAAAAQTNWLRTRLTAARTRGERVWVMAHIPPGINVYSSFHKFVLTPEKLCESGGPKPFLSSEALSDTITAFSDVVRLAIFAHTHMDEVKLLHNSVGGVVPAKIVPSVSPLNGNAPAFVVATTSPATSTLLDYSVYARVGATDRWNREYSFSQLYGMPDYSSQSLQTLASKLASDKTGDSETSRNYQKWFYPGDIGLYGLGLRQIWPAYACAIVEDGGAAFHDCMCPASGASK